MKTAWNWLTGKKTYIAAALLALSAVYGLHAGMLNDASFMAVIAGACGLVGLGHKADRYGLLLKDVLEALRAAQSKQPLDLSKLVNDVTAGDSVSDATGDSSQEPK